MITATLKDARAHLYMVLRGLKGQSLSSHNHADETERIAHDSVRETLTYFGVPFDLADEMANKHTGCALCRLGKCWRRLK